MYIRIFILSLSFLSSCTNTPSSSVTGLWQSFAARDNDHSFERPLLYRAMVPADWIRRDPLKTESIADTTKSICELLIQENDQLIRITIHTFPISDSTPRIPPQAQVERWKNQFENLNLASTKTTPESHGGFNGLFFEGEGLFQGQTKKMMSWAMQLASCYERVLSQKKEPLDTIKRADFTIKAIGPPEMMNRHHAAINAFAQSFEFIDELPSPI